MAAVGRMRVMRCLLSFACEFIYSFARRHPVSVAHSTPAADYVKGS